MYFRIVGSSGSIHFERSTQLLMSPEDVDPDGTVKHVVEGDLVTFRITRPAFVWKGMQEAGSTCKYL